MFMFHYGLESCVAFNEFFLAKNRISNPKRKLDTGFCFSRLTCTFHELASSAFSLNLWKRIPKTPPKTALRYESSDSLSQRSSRFVSDLQVCHNLSSESAFIFAPGSLVRHAQMGSCTSSTAAPVKPPDSPVSPTSANKTLTGVVPNSPGGETKPRVLHASPAQQTQQQQHGRRPSVAAGATGRRPSVGGSAELPGLVPGALHEHKFEEPSDPLEVVRKRTLRCTN